MMLRAFCIWRFAKCHDILGSSAQVCQSEADCLIAAADVEL
jgi:hypothetical protein